MLLGSWRQLPSFNNRGQRSDTHNELKSLVDKTQQVGIAGTTGQSLTCKSTTISNTITPTPLLPESQVDCSPSRCCYTRDNVPAWVRPVVRKVARELDRFFPNPFAEEIRGLSSLLSIDLGDMVILNIFNEFKMFCTSIVAQDTAGNIYHARNLDYLYTDFLRNISVDIDFTRDGKVSFTGTTFVGNVGVANGQRPEKFTLSIDARDGGSWWESAIEALLGRGHVVTWLVRNTLSTATDFKSAVVALSHPPLISNTYFIVGGVNPGEGAVITRRREAAVDTWFLQPHQGIWYLVETNYDHWKAPPARDDRRTPAMKALNSTGQANINLHSLLKVLSVKPILNNLTVYTTVMSAAQPQRYRSIKQMTP
ncbi:N-acylethanolamine-hydrolyzing acid amidase isoform X1 [Petromyzon marinus]|uniref:N-acylethanolamine-hydrolyzing acid amidase isoform X2 n=1 Tax=Petromyzon marinus TaxID=7757 RepID=A0AAJ7T6A3_PETMA|nr:N-acylethanolamine-hydrolyzing acid amidase isoform X2 [Petromyzon marinus]XP_032810949.1 N-acylethanolamine-hydrolyzing acid amidase isoform X2 [Petromyzon marinus]